MDMASGGEEYSPGWQLEHEDALVAPVVTLAVPGGQAKQTSEVDAPVSAL